VITKLGYVVPSRVKCVTVKLRACLFELEHLFSNEILNY